MDLLYVARKAPYLPSSVRLPLLQIDVLLTEIVIGWTPPNRVAPGAATVRIDDLFPPPDEPDTERDQPDGALVKTRNMAATAATRAVTDREISAA